MKVLFCTNLPSPYRVDFFNELGKLCDLTVCYERKSSSERDSKWISKSSGTYTEEFLNLQPVGTDKSKGSALRKYVKTHRFDLLIFTNYVSEACMEAITYCKLHHIPYCVEYDGGFNKTDPLPKKLLKQFLLKKAKAHLTTCDIHIEYLERLGIDRKNIYKYPFTSLHKSDLEHAQEKIKDGKEKYRQKLGMTENKIVISVGRFSYDRGYGKGYDIVMKLAEQMRDNIGFYIIGDEPTEEFLEIKEDKQLTNVHFVGFKTKGELEEYYLAADLFVLFTRGDIWGLVINEAMAYSLPVITTEVCLAGTELVNNLQNGFLVGLDNVEDKRKKINYLLRNNETRDQYASRSFELIQKYTIEKMAETHIDIFEDIIAQ